MSTFCSDIARSHAGVGLHGSATVAPHWLCIEHPDPWAAREIKQGTLPGSLVETIREWKDAVPGLRTQGIRREVRAWDAVGRITVLLASSSADDPVLWRCNVESYACVASLDVPRLVRAARERENAVLRDAGFARNAEPVILTCTNGKRDACCALKGRAFHQAVSDVAPHAAWQTTHLGGHRFAPTAVVLPYGHQYGWLTPDDAAGLWVAAQQNVIFRFDRYRGCTAYPRPVQAAAIALRERLQPPATHLADRRLQHVETEQQGEKAWTVRLRIGDVPGEVKVRRMHGPPAPASCGAKPKPTVRYETEVQ